MVETIKGEIRVQQGSKKLVAVSSLSFSLSRKGPSQGRKAHRKGGGIHCKKRMERGGILELYIKKQKKQKKHQKKKKKKKKRHYWRGRVQP